jgi:hypothetical protein
MKISWRQDVGPRGTCRARPVYQNKGKIENYGPHFYSEGTNRGTTERIGSEGHPSIPLFEWACCRLG